MNESYFWVEVIFDLELAKKEKLKDILKEADELTRILSVSEKQLRQKSTNNQSINRK